MVRNIKINDSVDTKPKDDTPRKVNSDFKKGPATLHVPSGTSLLINFIAIEGFEIMTICTIKQF